MTDDTRAALRSLAERSGDDGAPTDRATAGDGEGPERPTTRDVEEPPERAAGREDEGATDRTTTRNDPISRASAAVEDLDAAAAFVDGGGLEVLERAVERAEGERARRGEAALSALGACRRALE